MKKIIMAMLATIAIITGSLIGVQAQDQPTLLVGTNSGYPPYEFYATKDNKKELIGYDVDLANIIAKELKMKVKFIDMDFDAVISSLMSHKVDIGMAGLVDTPARRQSVDFSKPYMKTRTVVLYQKGHEDLRKLDVLKKQKIVAQVGTVQADAATYLNKNGALLLPAINDGVLSVESKQADAMLVAEISAKNIVAQKPNLAYTPLEGVPEQYKLDGASVALPKGSPLKSKIDNIITKLEKDGTLNKLYLKNSKLAGQVNEKQSDSKLNAFFNFSFLKDHNLVKEIGVGVMTTMAIALLGILIGIVVGIVLAIGKLSDSKIARGIATVYINYVRGTPLLLQLMILFYGIPLLFEGINPPSFLVGVIAVGLNSAAYVAEIYRGGIQSVDSGQFEAARSLGLTKWDTLKEIILPQATKNILPTLGNEFIVIIKETSIVSIIAIKDLMFYAKQVGSTTYNYLPPLIIAGIIYFIVTYTLTKLVDLLEGRLRND